MANKAGNTALHEAVRNRRGPVAEGLLDADPSRAYDLNEQMESPLHMAAREGLVQVVRKIVDYTWVGQEFLPSVSLSGTALHQAVLGTHHRKHFFFFFEKSQNCCINCTSMMPVHKYV